MYLLSGALGFTTTENLENIPLHYLNGGNVIYGVIPSVLKILIPIHVLCAYLQAFNLTKVRPIENLFLSSSFYACCLNEFTQRLCVKVWHEIFVMWFYYWSYSTECYFIYFFLSLLAALSKVLNLLINLPNLLLRVNNITLSLIPTSIHAIPTPLH